MCNHGHDFLPTSHCRILVRFVIAANQKQRVVMIFYKERMVISCCLDFEGFIVAVCSILKFYLFNLALRILIIWSRRCPKKVAIHYLSYKNCVFFVFLIK